MGDKHIAWLSDLSKNDVKLVGEKGANLGELFNAKFPVPQAFIVTTEAFRHFLKENNLEDEIKSILKRIKIEDESGLNKKSDEIRSLIINAKMPEKLGEEILCSYDNFNVDLAGLADSPGALAILKSSREPVFVSVRLSATDEDLFAKEQKTFTNVKGNDDLIDQIKICFASIFTPNSIFYRKEKGLEDFIEIAVIVQKMINSDKSGVIFSNNPAKDNDIFIEAIFGQGDGVISKKIVPDRYALSREMEIIDENISDKKVAVARTSGGQTRAVQLAPEKSVARVLKTYETKQLADFAMKIEEHFEIPQEIEFAIENEDFFILQTGPIRLSKVPHVEKENSEILSIVNTETKIKVAITSSEISKEAAKAGCDGVGLVKIEEIISRNKKHPLEYEKEGALDKYQKVLEDEFRIIAEAFDGKPIWVRTLDIRSDEYSDSEYETEKNPILGNHGIRFSLKHEGIFKAELSAIKNISDDGYKCGVMFPQVVSIDEIKKARAIFNELGMDKVRFGVTIGTPAAAILIKDICNEDIDFISFNIDDLAQYTLAVDKGNENILDVYDETSWAVLKLISRVIRECKNRGVQTSLFGSASSKQEMIEFLIKCGIDSVTVEPAEARKVSELIRKIEGNYVEELEVGDNLGQGGEEHMKEEHTNPEDVTEDVGEEVSPDIPEEPEEENEGVAEELGEHKEENLKNPLEPEEEPKEQRNPEKENPDEEPKEDKPEKEDIFT